MPNYALLGATGATGSAILRSLLTNSPDELSLKVLVRSRTKLLKLFPNIETQNVFKLIIVEGTADDSAKIQECLHDADVIFACIATNVPTLKMSLVTDTASEIIAALEKEKADSSSRPPTVIQLRSASLNLAYKAHFSYFARAMTWFCLGYVYEDLQRASDLFVAAAERDPLLLRYIFVDPPSIHDQDGTTPTGYKLVLDGKMTDLLNYADLGVAFCEVAERREEYAGKAVGVSATGKVTATWGTNIGFLLAGAKARVW